MTDPTRTLPARPAAGGLWLANLACMASMLIWAAGLPAADWLIDKLPPIPLTALRMALAALSLVPLWLILDRARGLTPALALRALWVGGLLGCGAVFLVVGQAMTDAVTVAIISASLPVAGIAIEMVADRRPLTLPLAAGLILSIAGALVAVGGRIGSLDIGLGAMACLVSVVTFALGSRLTVTGFPSLSPVGRTTITLAGAALTTGTIATVHAAMGGPVPDWSVLGRDEWAAMAIYSVGALGISQLLWILSIGRIGIGQASLHINAAPFYVMVFMLALGGGWDWRQTIGACIVALGVMVAQRIIPLTLPRPARIPPQP